MGAFAVFVVKLLDRAAIFLAAIAGSVSRYWWHVAAASAVIATVVEVALFATQFTRSFNPAVFAVGVFAAGVWVSLFFSLKNWWLRRRKQ